MKLNLTVYEVVAYVSSQDGRNVVLETSAGKTVHSILTSDENFQGKRVIAQLMYYDNNIVSIREMMDPQKQRESMIANAGKCAGLWSTKEFLKGEDED